jgi:hypothetical protein
VLSPDVAYLRVLRCISKPSSFFWDGVHVLTSSQPFIPALLTEEEEEAEVPSQGQDGGVVVI